MFATLTLALTVAAANPSSSLIGAWGEDEEIFFELKDGGKGTMDEDDIKWSVSGNKLKIVSSEGEVDEVPFVLEGDRLKIHMEGVELKLTRIGGKSKAKDAKAESAAPLQDKKPASDQLAHLLLSSAWCSFSYKAATGSSKQTRVAFAPDGSWAMSGNHEMNFTSQNGNVSSQSSSSNGGRWAVKEGRLLMSLPPDEPNLAPVNLLVKQNSNGYPILTANGVEYSMCQ